MEEKWMEIEEVHRVFSSVFSRRRDLFSKQTVICPCVWRHWRV